VAHIIAGDMDFEGKVNLRALIVEDNALYRNTLRECLMKLFPSMAIEEAADGKETLQKIGLFRPQIILMDIHLPDENGLQFTEKIKTKYPGTRVIIVTGYDCPEYREAAIRCEADGYIEKDSLNPAQVEHIVKSIIADLNKPR
jgi:DNA-binding NarL/FixJ family response regulator